MTEEDRMFVGVLIENLITSTWIGKWPKIQRDDSIKNNPMYMHIIKRVSKFIDKYSYYRKSNKFNNENQFEGIYMYSQIHVALSNKLFMKLSDTLTDNLKKYWRRLKPKAFLIKPNAKELKKYKRRLKWLY